MVQNIHNNIPTLFDYQHTVASKWDDEEFRTFCDQFDDDFIGKNGMGELALLYVDTIVAKDIEDGVNGVEYIAINPMWRSAWKKFWKQMVRRERNIISSTTDIEDETQSSESGEN